MTAVNTTAPNAQAACVASCPRWPWSWLPESILDARRCRNSKRFHLQEVFTWDQVFWVPWRDWCNDQRPPAAQGAPWSDSKAWVCVCFHTWMETSQSSCTSKTFSWQVHTRALTITSWCPPTSCLQPGHTDETAVRVWNHTPANTDSSSCRPQRRERLDKRITSKYLCKYLLTVPGDFFFSCTSGC